MTAGYQVARAAFAIAALQADLQVKLNLIKAFAALRLGDDAAVRYAMADTNDHEWTPKHRMGSGWCDSKCKLLSIQLVGVNLGQKNRWGAAVSEQGRQRSLKMQTLIAATHLALQPVGQAKALNQINLGLQPV